MKATATVSSKGQITIPLKIRTRLGLKRGDRVEFDDKDGKTVIRPARSEDNPFAKYIGVLGTFPGGVKEINAWIADLRDEEEEG
jgi:antitoxin PrlF